MQLAPVRILRYGSGGKGKILTSASQCVHAQPEPVTSYFVSPKSSPYDPSLPLPATSAVRTYLPVVKDPEEARVVQ